MIYRVNLAKLLAEGIFINFKCILKADLILYHVYLFDGNHCDLQKYLNQYENVSCTAGWVNKLILVYVKYRR